MSYRLKLVKQCGLYYNWINLGETKAIHKLTPSNVASYVEGGSGSHYTRKKFNIMIISKIKVTYLFDKCVDLTTISWLELNYKLIETHYHLGISTLDIIICINFYNVLY